MDFKQLKKQSKTGIGALTEKLLKEAEKLNSGSYSENLNEFKLETDKAGNGRAILRFLPAPAGEEAPFVRLYNHGFQVNNKWLIENCPTTLGEVCPV
jgi:gp32 DNA binding protein like